MGWGWFGRGGEGCKNHLLFIVIVIISDLDSGLNLFAALTQDSILQMFDIFPNRANNLSASLREYYSVIISNF